MCTCGHRRFSGGMGKTMGHISGATSSLRASQLVQTQDAWLTLSTKSRNRMASGVGCLQDTWVRPVAMPTPAGF
jgi:hypothetical protein